MSMCLLLLTGRYPLVKGTPKNFSAEKFFEASPIDKRIAMCCRCAPTGQGGKQDILPLPVAPTIIAHRTTPCLADFGQSVTSGANKKQDCSPLAEPFLVA